MIHPVPYRRILAALVARLGYRFSNLDAKRAGVAEHVLFDAVCCGLAKLERTHATGGSDVSIYLVLA